MGQSKAVTNEKITSFGKYVQAILKAMKGKPYVKVGFPTADFKKAHKGPTGKTPYSQGQVAMANEFGTTRIPERSFIRSTAIQKKGDMRKFMGYVQGKVARGELTVFQALSQVGIRHMGQVQKTISSGVPPPNKESTVNAKGSSTTLIDTGEMRQNVNYEVVMQGPPK